MRHRATNWAGNQVYEPLRGERPGSVQEVSELLTRAAREGLTVRPKGTGHSFTGVCVTGGVQVHLERLAGLVAGDDGKVAARNRDGSALVRVKAGTTLVDLCRLLDEQGLALPNMGDINVQTTAGAISTGTHGTGDAFPGLAGMVEALEIVLPDGSVHRCSRGEEPDLFHAAVVGLGAFGIVTEYTLRVVQAFRILAVEEPARTQDVLGELDALVAENDHVEFFWFPGTDRVLMKRNRRLSPDDPTHRPLRRWRARLEDEFLSNDVFEVANRVAAAVPSTARTINSLSGRALSARTYTAPSYDVFASPRRVKFTESEYAVPRAALPHVLRELHAWFERTGSCPTIPVEVRFAAPDDIWLSTGYERENAYVAVHQFHTVDDSAYFEAFAAIAGRFEGRPHWGKIHPLTAGELARLYPRFADAVAVRDRVDPDRMLANDYLTRVLGA